MADQTALTSRAPLPVSTTLRPWLTAEETAERFGVTTRTMYRHLRDGDLPIRTVRIGRLWRINRSDLEAFLSEV